MKFEKEVGRGAYGVVYQAKWRGGLVAVKALISNLQKSELEEFEAEAMLMKSIRPHRNVVQLQGLSTSVESPLCIVSG